MAASPIWKLYNADKVYQAASKDVVLLAACIGILGTGATIRRDHGNIVWTEGVDGIAAQSYDAVVHVCYDRVQAMHDRGYDNIHGEGAAARERGLV